MTTEQLAIARRFAIYSERFIPMEERIRQEMAAQSERVNRLLEKAKRLKEADERKRWMLERLGKAAVAALETKPEGGE